MNIISQRQHRILYIPVCGRESEIGTSIQVIRMKEVVCYLNYLIILILQFNIIANSINMAELIKVYFSSLLGNEDDDDDDDILNLL